MSSQVFNISSGGDSTTFLDNLSHCLIALTVKRKQKSVFLCLYGIPCVSICAHGLILSTSTAEKSLAPFSSFPLIRYLYTPIRSHLSLLFSKLKIFSCLSLSSCQRCSIKNDLEHTACKVMSDLLQSLNPNQTTNNIWGTFYKKPCRLDPKTNVGQL